MSRRKKGNKLAFVLDNPPDRRGQRQTVKLLKLLDELKPITGPRNKEHGEK
ncbi:MAG: hypothetical protein NTW21_37590 [Verrucomicrobia bacterium]|nr:hypothetical protein [Verrucomicrobiota bacterium]